MTSRGILGRGLAVAGTAVLLGTAGAGTAQALTLPAGWQSDTTAGTRTVALPVGAQRVQLIAIGGNGGGSRGGSGAVVSGTVDVAGWTQLELRTGRNGGFRVTTTVEGIAFPGQGGSASFARLCNSVTRRCAPVAIAAGGGGSGGGTSIFAVAAGGAAGASGADGAVGAPDGAGAGGAAGSSTGGAGGTGGLAACLDGYDGPVGERGAALYGGDGGYPRQIAPGTTGRIGGSGGEGWFGGGGGGAAAACDEVQQGGAGGGGGGSNLVPAGGTVALNSAAPAEVPSVSWFFELERAAPTVVVTSPADGASYRRGEVVRAAFACADEPGGSDIADCVGTVARDVSIDTATTGTKTFTVTGRDRAGNVTTQTVTYTVTPPPVTLSGLFANARAVQFTLSTPARVTLRIERRKPGRRVRWTQVGTLRATGRSGFNTVRLNGRVGKRRLAPGAYRVRRHRRRRRRQIAPADENVRDQTEARRQDQR